MSGGWYTVLWAKGFVDQEVQCRILPGVGDGILYLERLMCTHSCIYIRLFCDLISSIILTLLFYFKLGTDNLCHSKYNRWDKRAKAQKALYFMMCARDERTSWRRYTAQLCDKLISPFDSRPRLWPIETTCARCTTWMVYALCGDERSECCRAQVP